MKPKQRNPPLPKLVNQPQSTLILVEGAKPDELLASILFLIAALEDVPEKQKQPVQLQLDQWIKDFLTGVQSDGNPKKTE